MIVFIDMFGGILFNLVIFIMDKVKVEVIVGINLLMFICLVKVCKEVELVDVVELV